MSMHGHLWVCGPFFLFHRTTSEHPAILASGNSVMKPEQYVLRTCIWMGAKLSSTAPASVRPPMRQMPMETWLRPGAWFPMASIGRIRWLAPVRSMMR
jgi:hypothetical protein